MTRATVRSSSPWAVDEDAEILAGYPSYSPLMQRLPQRILASIKHRARRLGVVAPRHVWTSHEVRDLSNAYRRYCRNAELLQLFPHLTLSQITRKAYHLGLSRHVRRLPLLSKSRQDLQLGAIARAAKLLGGDVAIAWSAFD